MAPPCGGQPLVHAGVVYALVDPQQLSLPSLNAYRASDGTLLWSASHPQGKENGRIERNSSAIYADVGTLQTAAFSPRDGHQLWTGGGGSLVAATDSAIFIQDRDNHLGALSATDGSRLWQSSISVGYYSNDFDVTPVVNSVLYVTGSSSSSGGIAAVRTRDGTELWQHTNLYVEAVIVMNGVAYLYTIVSPSECLLGACTGQVVALNAATGALLWQKSVPEGQLLAEPVASDEAGGQ
ncbi:MAG: hypothetical protein C5B60_01675 [Chloroflexi bacterium]|nr:MAG: hypothetical protein C5B60_01675 [Chloroflexota bacterium]